MNVLGVCGKIKQMSFSFSCIQKFLQYGKDTQEEALPIKKGISKHQVGACFFPVSGDGKRCLA